MTQVKAAKRVVPKVLALVAAGAVLTVGAVALRAADRPFPPRTAEEIVAHLSEKLELTAEQSELLAPVIAGGLEGHREIGKKYGKEVRELKRTEREEQRGVESSVDEQVASILTPEQMEEYRQLKEERSSRRRGRGEGMGGGPLSPDRALMRLSERLELTGEQEDLLLPIVEDGFDQRRELFEGLRSQEVIERSAVRSQMEELASGMDERVAAVLTAEQMEEFRRIQEERRSLMDGKLPFGGRGGF